MTNLFSELGKLAAAGANPHGYVTPGLVDRLRYGTARVIGGKHQIPDQQLSDQLARLAQSLDITPDELRTFSPLDFVALTGGQPRYRSLESD